MNEFNRDALQSRLRAGDPYQGESLPASDAARIKAQIRAGAPGARVRLKWMPAAAAAAMVAVVALGIWLGSRPSMTEEPSMSPSTAVSAGAGGPDAPPPISIPETQPVGEPARASLAVVHPAPAPPARAEDGPAFTRPGSASETEVALAAVSAAASATPTAAARRMQFTARGGTRIVWTIDPDFEPSMTRTDAPTAPHQQGANGKW